MRRWCICITDNYDCPLCLSLSKLLVKLLVVGVLCATNLVVSRSRVIKSPGMSPLKIPLKKPNNVAQGVSLWKWSGSALDEGNEAAECILVDGCEPFAEDLWKEFRINKLNFEGVKLCDRCKIPTIDINSGIAGPEPTKTLLTFRSDKILRPHVKPQGKVYFGQNLVWKDNSSVEKGKVVKAGDPVFVLKKYSSIAEVPAN
ncbi:hypothetical protein K2173_017848 [Erythroxylum novogranatense]|uniref:MOSC domain-containing protein n=1 Tax=Erythroxylum novogranatense TaxID=1862640 RepID=A0AAV8T2F7_9ROSI|nr:hypothetical protein K2173_017848 [Erythroxylum novogranatense]